MRGHLREMMDRFARPGSVEWIGLRPDRRAGMRPVESARINDTGLDGDHGRAGKRAVTLIQAEHLPVIAALSGRDEVSPDVLRRNLVISGLNLAALRGRRVLVGGAILELTTICAPCSRMEEVLGPGGYNAVRGHGGLCARVIRPGLVARGDAVQAEVWPFRALTPTHPGER